MALTPGTRLGPYEVTALIGAGGMGEVYRARDTKLGRAVAVKVLLDAFLFDPDRVARFEREAKALASLNHPHIAVLYGMEQDGGGHFLVMELVEGDTLAERIAAGGKHPAIPLDEALSIARQIAEALEAAHEKGVVHRDLKPANVKITPDGHVKVLDFGLARMGSSGTDGSGGEGLTHSPTLSMMATQAGVILGTAAYMSPEQAKGLQADARSDVFSFGSVLYEMLTGRQAFQGDTATDVLASVLAREADLSALPSNLNARIPELLSRCLQKNPKRRWQAVGDLRAELEIVAASPRAATVTPQPAAPTRPLWTRAMPFLMTALATAVVAGALAAVAVGSFRPAVPVPIVTRFPFMLPEGQQLAETGLQSEAISPDGTQMAYVANQRLYLRSMSDLAARPIPGSEVTQGTLGDPVFSPDGRSIVFWSGPGQTGTLKRIAVSGGAAVTICQCGYPFGLSWSDGGIMLSQGGDQEHGLIRVSANGSKPDMLIAAKSGEILLSPQLLPGGTAVLFTQATGTAGVSPTADVWDNAHVVVQSLTSGERKTLIEGGSAARYLPTGHLIYASGGTLLAVPFDLKRLAVTGGPVPVVEGVARTSGASIATGSAHFAVSDTGTLLYVPGSTIAASSLGNLVVVDRTGSVEPLKLAPGPYQFPRVSPDGRRIAVGIDDGKDASVSIYDLSGATSMRRLTFGGKNRFPVWSADGARVAFQSDREGDLGIFWQRADGTGKVERLTKPDQGTSHVPQSWSSDGKTFLYEVTKGSQKSLWTLSVQDKKAAPFVEVQSLSPLTGVFSPDGRWVAYQATDGATAPIFVEPFPRTDAKYLIAQGGQPLWSPDGKELVFHQPDEMVGVSVSTQPSFTFGNPVLVLKRHGWRDGGPFMEREYDVTPDGKRFIFVADAAPSQPGAPVAPQIQVVLNWFEELKQRVPTR